MTDEQRLDVAVSWAAVVKEFETLSADLMANISKASGFIGDASPLTERVDALKKAINEGERRQAEAR